MERLTHMARGAGCGCKLGKAALLDALRGLPPVVDDRVLVGLDGADDATVVRVRDDLAICASVDFFTPVVDDPHTFGAIAAANALSDLHAMGATPLLALATAAFPRDGDPVALAAIMRGGAERALAEGCPVLGGHTIDDPEPKYGLCVIGTVHPDRLLTNAAGRPGDRLFLTKPLGIGVTAAGTRSGAAGPGLLEEAVGWMLTSNRDASRAALAAGVRCATDVTGFGLVGHLHEMAAASGTSAHVHAGSVPALDGALALIRDGYAPGGTDRNRAFAEPHLHVSDGVPPEVVSLLLDPQTSGGLLIAAAGRAADALMAGLADRDLPVWEVGVLAEGVAGRIELTAGS